MFEIVMNGPEDISSAMDIEFECHWVRGTIARQGCPDLVMWSILDVFLAASGGAGGGKQSDDCHQLQVVVTSTSSVVGLVGLDSANSAPSPHTSIQICYATTTDLSDQSGFHLCSKGELPAPASRVSNFLEPYGLSKSSKGFSLNGRKWRRELILCFKLLFSDTGFDIMNSSTSPPQWSSRQSCGPRGGKYRSRCQNIYDIGGLVSPSCPKPCAPTLLTSLWNEAGPRLWIDVIFFRVSAMLSGSQGMVLIIEQHVPAEAPSQTLPHFQYAKRQNSNGLFVTEAKQVGVPVVQHIPHAVAGMYACAKDSKFYPAFCPRLSLMHIGPHSSKKRIIRGALTNGQEWIFLIFYLSEDEIRGTYADSPIIKIQNEFGRDPKHIFFMLHSEFHFPAYRNPLSAEQYIWVELIWRSSRVRPKNSRGLSGDEVSRVQVSYFMSRVRMQFQLWPHAYCARQGTRTMFGSSEPVGKPP
ncbi:uncharacterized protein EI90DRAFT_3295720 [Cantharellus anzutake]|uniref:uncharacterized protein n=1 Tax=Cantharellus anzutake TaxID=1750568 RepID=UPI0019039A7D|nr:uncharacterized protein EI90DRAFT_3295720 [Cantharellus anzutake]KAF8310724.1 hypothetical protein EI90DRAFT_3295720 [Cantharellus anzutake]